MLSWDPKVSRYGASVSVTRQWRGILVTAFCIQLLFRILKLILIFKLGNTFNRLSAKC